MAQYRAENEQELKIKSRGGKSKIQGASIVNKHGAPYIDMLHPPPLIMTAIELTLYIEPMSETTLKDYFRTSNKKVITKQVPEFRGDEFIGCIACINIKRHWCSALSVRWLPPRPSFRRDVP